MWFNKLQAYFHGLRQPKSSINDLDYNHSSSNLQTHILTKTTLKNLTSINKASHRYKQTHNLYTLKLTIPKPLAHTKPLSYSQNKQTLNTQSWVSFNSKNLLNYFLKKSTTCSTKSLLLYSCGRTLEQ